MNNRIKRIALIGPESTGKTTLAEQLAKHYQTAWVPEYSRNYVENLNRKYTKEDILLTIREQCAAEDRMLEQANKFLFADTEPILAQVWMMDVYHEKSVEIEKLIQERAYDLYLLLSPDLPYVNDPVRENPARRDFFFDWYKKELEERQLPYRVITGTGASRLEFAIKEIESLREN